MRVNLSPKSDIQSVLSYVLNNGHNHPSFVVNVIKASTGGILYTSDVMWSVPSAPVLPLPAPAIAGGSAYAAEPGMPGFNISICNVTTIDSVTRATATAAVAPAPGGRY